MSLQLELSEQSDTSIEEVPPKEEDRLLQEEPDEDVLKLKVDLNTSEKFEEQVDNLVPTNKNPLESLVVICQHIMSDSQLHVAVNNATLPAKLDWPITATSSPKRPMVTYLVKGNQAQDDIQDLQRMEENHLLAQANEFEEVARKLMEKIGRKA